MAEPHVWISMQQGWSIPQDLIYKAVDLILWKFIQNLFPSSIYLVYIFLLRLADARFLIFLPYQQRKWDIEEWRDSAKFTRKAIAHVKDEESELQFVTPSTI